MPRKRKLSKEEKTTQSLAIQSDIKEQLNTLLTAVSSASARLDSDIKTKMQNSNLSSARKAKPKFSIPLEGGQTQITVEQPSGEMTIKRDEQLQKLPILIELNTQLISLKSAIEKTIKTVAETNQLERAKKAVDLLCQDEVANLNDTINENNKNKIPVVVTANIDNAIVALTTLKELSKQTPKTRLNSTSDVAAASADNNARSAYSELTSADEAAANADTDNPAEYDTADTDNRAAYRELTQSDYDHLDRNGKYDNPTSGEDERYNKLTRPNNSNHYDRLNRDEIYDDPTPGEDERYNKLERSPNGKVRGATYEEFSGETGHNPDPPYDKMREHRRTSHYDQMRNHHRPSRENSAPYDQMRASKQQIPNPIYVENTGNQKTDELYTIPENQQGGTPERQPSFVDDGPRNSFNLKDAGLTSDSDDADLDEITHPERIQGGATKPNIEPRSLSVTDFRNATNTLTGRTQGKVFDQRPPFLRAGRGKAPPPRPKTPPSQEVRDYLEEAARKQNAGIRNNKGNGNNPTSPKLGSGKK